MNRQRDQSAARAEQPVMLDQQLALSAYLEALLCPAPLPVEVVVETLTEIAPELEVPPQIVAMPAAVEMPAIDTAPLSSGSEPSRSHPEWATSNFQCLLFRVAGLLLAVPMAKLNGVLPWDAAQVTPMPGRQPWFLGLRSNFGQQVRLIDVAKVVVPQAQARAVREFGKVILIGSGHWGLVCEDIAEVVELAPAAVKWRVNTGNRPWLAGTVIDRMCALIDADAFAAMLGSEGSQAT